MCAWHERFKWLRDILAVPFVIAIVAGVLIALVSAGFRDDLRQLWDQNSSISLAGTLSLGLLLLLTAAMAEVTRRGCLRSDFRLFKRATGLVPEDLNFQQRSTKSPRNLLHRPYDPEYIRRTMIPRPIQDSSGRETPSTYTYTYTEKSLREKLREDGTRETTGFVLLGPPTEGKTRTLFEIIRELDGYLVVGPKEKAPSDDALDLLRGESVILLLDNLDNFAGTQLDLVDLWTQLKKVTKGNVVIVATCRDGPELAHVEQSLTNPSLTKLYEAISLKLRLESVSDQDKARFAESIDWQGKHADEYPTLGFLALSDAIQPMIQRYDSLRDVEQATLQAMLLLTAAGVEPLSHERLRAVLKAIFKFEVGAFGPILGPLARNDFLHSSEDDPCLPEQAYLKYAVPYREGKTEVDDFPGLQAILRESKDAEGLFYLGYTYTRVLGDAQQALNCNNQALQLHPYFPNIWNNKGTVLSTLQRYDEALVAYDQAPQLRRDFPQASEAKRRVLVELERHATSG